MTEGQEKVSRDLQIVRAWESDLDTVWGIIKADSDWLESQGMSHWTHYYSRELIEKKLKRQEVYIARNSDGVVGTITLDTNPVDYYTDEDMQKFEDPSARGLYATALAVLPEYQGKGIASKLMEFVEAQAKERGIRFVRFDCRASYLKLVEFYKRRRYKIVGEIIDDADNNELYYLMEKKINL